MIFHLKNLPGIGNKWEDAIVKEHDHESQDPILRGEFGDVRHTL